MSDPLGRDQFPDRPEHSDFWRLAEITLRLDGRATEGKVSMPDQVREYVDPDCLTYLAFNRAAMALREVIPSETLRRMLLPLAAALITDGFAIGATFERERQP